MSMKILIIAIIKMGKKEVSDVELFGMLVVMGMIHGRYNSRRNDSSSNNDDDNNVAPNICSCSIRNCGISTMWFFCRWCECC